MRGLKRVAKKIPVVREIARSVIAGHEICWLKLERAKLLRRGEVRLARGLDGRDFGLSSLIEQCRVKMAQNKSLLVDGTLGPAAIYDEGQTVADACSVSKRAHSARLLHSLAAEYQPETILELGTNVGISSAYLAAAGGSVVTLDASAYRQRLARELHNSLNLQVDYVQGLFADTLVATLDRGLGVVPDRPRYL